MTREEWLQRYIGAYEALCGDDAEAEEAALCYEGVSIDTEADGPVESATRDYFENTSNESSNLEAAD